METFHNFQRHVPSLLSKIINVANSPISLRDDAVHNLTPLCLESDGFLEV